MLNNPAGALMKRAKTRGYQKYNIASIMQGLEEGSVENDTYTMLFGLALCSNYDHWNTIRKCFSVEEVACSLLGLCSNPHKRVIMEALYEIGTMSEYSYHKVTNILIAIHDNPENITQPKMPYILGNMIYLKQLEADDVQDLFMFLSNCNREFGGAVRRSTTQPFEKSIEEYGHGAVNDIIKHLELFMITEAIDAKSTRQLAAKTKIEELLNSIIDKSIGYYKENYYDSQVGLMLRDTLDNIKRCRRKDYLRHYVNVLKRLDEDSVKMTGLLSRQKVRSAATDRNKHASEREGYGFTCLSLGVCGHDCKKYPPA